VLFGGRLVDPRTAEMLSEVEALTGDTLHIWQGSYSAGAKSGGTHTGGGAVDVSPTKGSWDALVAATRQVGFAAWHRTPEQGYDPHVHAIAVGCVDLSPEAAQQVAWYRQGLNGLWPGRQGPDDGPRNHVGVTWETYQEDSMPTVKEVWEYPITRDAGGGRLVKIPMWRSVLDAVDTGRQATAAVARLEAEQDRAVVWCVRWCTFALAAQPSKVKRFGSRLTWHLERCRSRLRWAGVGEGAIEA
jgi:hypothetical protein